MKTDILTNGSMFKNHISLKTDSDNVQYGEFRSNCGLIHQLQGHFQDKRVIAQHLLPARLHNLQ